MKNRIIYIIVIFVVGILGYWLGYRQRLNYCTEEYTDKSAIAPIPIERARELYHNYVRFSGCLLSSEASSILSFPLVIDEAKQGLSDIFMQKGYKDLIMYPGINVDSLGKPFFTVIFIGRDSTGTLITTQSRQLRTTTTQEVIPVPIRGDDIVQDDNRPCKPCPGL